MAEPCSQLQTGRPQPRANERTEHYGWSMVLTSLHARNPRSPPTQGERAVLLDFQRRAAAGGTSPGDGTHGPREGRRFTLRPLRARHFHGRRISIYHWKMIGESSHKAISRLYPGDGAAGLAPESLRGLRAHPRVRGGGPVAVAIPRRAVDRAALRGRLTHLEES